jgi:FKBP-type peptidyl-prolyl cis-trans isomerase SlyD
MKVGKDKKLSAKIKVSAEIEIKKTAAKKAETKKLAAKKTEANIKVEKDKVVLMHYTLKNDAGDIIDSSDGGDPLPFLQGHGNIIPGLESSLEGCKVGEKLEVSIEPEEGYGLRMKDAIQEIPSSALQGVEEVKVGMQLQSQDKDGNAFLVSVTKIEDDKITVDGNHPLAGQTLHFSVSIESIRDAEAEELSHGHVHADGQHHH